MTTNSLLTTRKRLLIIVISVTFLFCGLLGRLFYVQIIDGNSLQTKAAEQWYRDLPLSAPRGDILDDNGEVLADSRDVYAVYVRPNAVKDPEKAVKVLSENLGLDKDKLMNKIKSSKVSEITVMREVEEDAAKAIRDADVKGIYLTLSSKRNYPGNNLLTQVMGFCNIDNVGQNGLEGYYDKYLKGVDGFAYTATDIKGNELQNNVTRYVPAVPGCDVSLSVDLNIQSFAETAVLGAKEEWGAKSTSMIVMDCTTGGIAAMAMSPSFDINNPPRDDMDALNALSKNKMIVDVYEPGSTFKIFTTATAIDKGVASAQNRFFCPGYRVVDGQRIKCWRSIGHGSQSLPEGVMNSCNCVFMDLALKLGTKNLYEGLRNFGLGQKTNVDFFGESRGILMNESSVKTVDLARIGFGQAVAVTPLQLITAVSAAVNGGILYEPYFVKSVDTYDGKNVYTRQPKAVRQAVSPATSAVMREFLENVVSKGSGKKAGVAGYRIGGKTGTAQKYENGHIAQGKYISSFVGFAPADNPKYVILMLVDEPSSYVYYGSLTAAPYVGDVFEKIFAYKDIKPVLDIEKPETISMPMLDGMNVSEAAALIKKLGLQCEIAGEGNTVVSTTPSPTTLVNKGDIILIRTD